LSILPVLMDTRIENNLGPEGEIALKCLFFAQYSELLGRTELELTVRAGASVSDVIELVRTEVPGGAQLPDGPLVARNQRHVKPGCLVEGGDELAFLPPLGGG